MLSPQRKNLWRMNLKAQINKIRYRGTEFSCPICESDFSRFFSHGVVKRLHAKCPSCHSLERHRFLWLYFKESRLLESIKGSFLHIAPEYCYYKHLKKLFGPRYVPADLRPKLPGRVEDLTRLSFDSQNFDFVMANHVLEHIPQDILAIKEIYRVLKPGGRALLLTPVKWEMQATVEDLSVGSDEERLKRYGHPEHVRIYGADFLDRIRLAGFEVEVINYKVDPDLAKRYSLRSEPIIQVIKR